MNPLVAAVILEAVAIVLLLAAGAGLYRRVRELELATFRGIGLSITGTSGAGAGAALNAGRRALVVKVNRQCAVCAEILSAIDEASARLPSDTDVVVVSDDPSLGWRSAGRVRLVTDPLVWRSIAVPYAPAMLVVDEQGTVTFSSPVGSAAALTDLITRTFPITSEVNR